MSTPHPLLTLCRLPVFGAPMFLVSSPTLVIAQCRSGIIGCFPSLNARPQSQLRDWIQEIQSGICPLLPHSETHPTAPFGINLVALSNNKRLSNDFSVCVEEKVPIIITSMQPPKEFSQEVHRYGGLHFHDATTLRHAEKAIDAGVDGLVLVCSGAGGHGGQLNPFAFVKAVRKRFDGLIALAGGMTTGGDIRAAQLMGADFAYIGTRFIATEEAHADIQYKNMLINSSISDIIYTPQFTGVNVNLLKGSIESLGINPKKVTPPRIGKPSKLTLWWKHQYMKRRKAWKDIWSAGQGVSNIHDIIPVSEYVDRLESEYLDR